MASTHWFLERNPLLEKLPTFDDLGRLADAIRFHPLAGLDMNALTVMQRISLLVMEKFPFEPTEQSISAAITMIGMLFGSLQARNPLRAETRRELWTYLDAAASGATTLPISTIATFSAYALKGITGTGKSVLVHMVRQLFPEKIVHSPCAEAGWTQMVHLVHLYVKLSHDGTRGGFLTGILLEMDRVLGTDYAVTLRRRHRTVEGLSVATVAQLHAHYLGILFVDEGQMRNLIESGQAELMQMFLLMILNSGIPVVFMGNPLAYEWLATFSQDLRRLHEKPPAFLHPIGAVPGGDEDADGDAIFLGVSRYYVLRKPLAWLRRAAGL